MFRLYPKQSSVLIFTLICVLGWTPDAQAYFDPGTGSMVLQLLMASILGFVFTLKTYWRKFKDFIQNLVGKNSSDDYRNLGLFYLKDKIEHPDAPLYALNNKLEKEQKIIYNGLIVKYRYFELRKKYR